MNLFQLLRNNKPLPEVLTADSLARQSRMAEKLAIIKAEMGEKYLLHKSNSVKKCVNCNAALGHVKDNVKILEAMIKYLKEN